MSPGFAGIGIGIDPRKIQFSNIRNTCIVIYCTLRDLSKKNCG